MSSFRLQKLTSVASLPSWVAISGWEPPCPGSMSHGLGWPWEKLQLLENGLVGAVWYERTDWTYVDLKSPYILSYSEWLIWFKFLEICVGIFDQATLSCSAKMTDGRRNGISKQDLDRLYLLVVEDRLQSLTPHNVQFIGWAAWNVHLVSWKQQHLPHSWMNVDN